MADYQEIVRASNTDYSADETQWPSADGGLLENLVWVYEPVGTIVTADTTSYSADNTTWPTADGGELAGALDLTDAEVIPATAVGEPGGGIPPWLRQRPYPIWGYGDGVLPELEGEAYGVVATRGESRGNFALDATALGVCGTVATADAVCKLGGHASGDIGARGAGSGIVDAFKVSATGQFDDEAAVIALLLAA